MKNALRWKMAILITAAIAISYFDRQTLPVAIHAIQREIPVSNVQFSHLQAAFLCAYALMYAGSGKLIDFLGTRRGFLLIMIWWSLACASLGLATSVTFLAVQPVPAGHGRRWRISCRNKSDGRVVSGARALYGNGLDERRHGGGRRCGTPADCPHAAHI